MPDRAPGFYWVRRLLWPDQWEVAQLDKRGWMIFGYDEPTGEYDFAEIGPRVESPEEALGERSACLAIVEAVRDENEAAYRDVHSADRISYAYSGAADACERIIAEIRKREPVNQVAAPREGG